MANNYSTREFEQHRVVESGLIQDFNSPAADAIIRLQSNIDFASLDQKISCYAVTSAQEAEGKTTMACNLALLYAEKGLKVCLLDLDLRQPAIHKLFRLQNNVGIVEYVKGDVENVEDIIHNTKGVDVITAGTSTPFPSRVLSSVRMEELIKELKTRYDFVILDTPPVLVVSDAYIIGSMIDGYLIVCSQHISKKKDIVSACQSLTDRKLNIIGITMTMVTSDEDQGKGGYGYAAGYGYGYRYGYRGHYGGYHSGYYGGYHKQEYRPFDKPAEEKPAPVEEAPVKTKVEPTPNVEETPAVEVTPVETAKPNDESTFVEVQPEPSFESPDQKNETNS